MRILSRTCLLAALTLAAQSAAAAEWTHVPLMLGQFEGHYSTDESSIFYSCSGLSSSVSFSANGLHVAKGDSSIKVDGKEVLSGNTVYNSTRDITSIGERVEQQYGDRLKNEYNTIINALASGNEAVWTTPNGETFTFDLTGSSDIRNCLVN
jgi:hypothetical protein